MSVQDRGESRKSRNSFGAQLTVGLAGAAVIAVAAHRAKALTRGGMTAATIVGAVVFAGTGVSGSVGLIAFFTSSTVLGHLPAISPLSQARGNTRDAIQVLANGGVPMVLASMSALGPEPIRPLCRVGFAGALAAAAADTWATEIGSRSPESPRSIVSLRPVPIGESGGVTIAGLLASGAGALLIAWLVRHDTSTVQSNLAAALGGVVGSLADSLLGATVQSIRFCDTCHRRTEFAICCGEPTSMLRGTAGINNDSVNVLASAVGASVAMTASKLLTDTGGDGQDATATRRQVSWRFPRKVSRRGI